MVAWVMRAGDGTDPRVVLSPVLSSGFGQPGTLRRARHYES